MPSSELVDLHIQHMVNAAELVSSGAAIARRRPAALAPGQLALTLTTGWRNLRILFHRNQLPVLPRR